MFLILLQYFLHQCIQNRLFALEMTVKRCLPNAHCAGNLGNRGSFKPLHREQFQRRFQNFLLCVSSLHNEYSFTTTKHPVFCDRNIVYHYYSYLSFGSQ